MELKKGEVEAGDLQLLEEDVKEQTRKAEARMARTYIRISRTFPGH
jgi:hypothetical protein